MFESYAAIGNASRAASRHRCSRRNRRNMAGLNTTLHQLEHPGCLKGPPTNFQTSGCAMTLLAGKIFAKIETVVLAVGIALCDLLAVPGVESFATRPSCREEIFPRRATCWNSGRSCDFSPQKARAWADHMAERFSIGCKGSLMTNFGTSFRSVWPRMSNLSSSMMLLPLAVMATLDFTSSLVGVGDRRHRSAFGLTGTFMREAQHCVES